MLYMVEMNLVDTTRRAAWNAWYEAHIDLLLSIPGFHASQRFVCLHDHPSPYVALHEIDGPDLFDTEIYRSCAGPAGTGEWRTRMDNWHRNIFSGLDHTPDVVPAERLVIAEDGADACWLAGADPVRLTTIGLDRSVSYRTIAVCSDARAAKLIGAANVRVLRPLGARRTAPAGSKPLDAGRSSGTTPALSKAGSRGTHGS